MHKIHLEHHEAFLNTTYRVLQSPFVDIKISQSPVEFCKLENWAFITAWNPLPQILSLEENQIRNKQLEEDIKQIDLKYTVGLGISQDELWSEESFFIENINLSIANQLACKYGQLAFVYGESDQNAELVYTVF
jgi:hypothetical protein